MLLLVVEDEGWFSTLGFVFAAKSPPDLADSPARESEVTVPGFSTLVGCSPVAWDGLAVLVWEGRVGSSAELEVNPEDDLP